MPLGVLLAAADHNGQRKQQKTRGETVAARCHEMVEHKRVEYQAYKACPPQ